MPTAAPATTCPIYKWPARPAPSALRSLPDSLPHRLPQPISPRTRRRVSRLSTLRPQAGVYQQAELIRPADLSLPDDSPRGGSTARCDERARHRLRAIPRRVIRHRANTRRSPSCKSVASLTRDYARVLRFTTAASACRSLCSVARNDVTHDAVIAP